MSHLYAAFAFLGVIWGSNFIDMEWAAALISPAQVTLLRMLFGFLTLAVVAGRRRVTSRIQFRFLPHFYGRPRHGVLLRCLRAAWSSCHRVSQAS
jgi:drug/metabolite transporter (DMT)-like permease